MAREIKGTIYQLTYTAAYKTFVECQSIEDLYAYIAAEEARGFLVSGVNEVCRDMSHPRVAVYTKKEYKETRKKVLEEKNR